MLSYKKPVLKDSIKLDFLRRMFNSDSLSAIFDELQPDQIIEAQRFIWEKTIEFGIKVKGKDFSQDELMERFKPVSAYQMEMKCDYPASKCRGTECFYSDPECAINKAKNQVDVMSKIINELLGFDTE